MQVDEYSLVEALLSSSVVVQAKVEFEVAFHPRGHRSQNHQELEEFGISLNK